MAVYNGSTARVIPFLRPNRDRKKRQDRKRGLNTNKQGSVRKINGKAYVDFRYLGERVRECSGLDWNEKNAKQVRAQLDRIVVAIQSGTFKFAKVFPESNNAEYFSKEERALSGSKKGPDEVPPLKRQGFPIAA